MAFLFDKLTDIFYDVLVLGRYRSGQPGQTVNLLAYAFVGSNPTRPTKIKQAKACFFVFIYYFAIIFAIIFL